MDETQSAGMEHLTGAEFEAVLYVSLIAGRSFPTENLRSAISLVAEQRMPNVLHVGSDLMRTPRLENTLYQSDIAIALEHLIVGHGRLTDIRVCRENLHAQTVFRISSDITLYPSPVVREVPPDESIVAAVSRLIEKLLA